MSDDDAGTTPAGRDELRGLLLGLGCSEEELDRAEADGTLTLLAIERIVMSEPQKYTIPALAERTGMTIDQVSAVWRSLGFPEPAMDEAVFTDADVEILGAVAEMIEIGAIDPALIMQMSRVIGSSMNRIAQALVDAVTPGIADDEGVNLDRVSARAGMLLPTMPRVLENTWRRHLQDAARRRLMRGAQGEVDLVVGFADLVGFTALSQQVTDRELAAIVDQFETLAYDVITTEGGRVVKMIGDEVMFVVESPEAAAEIALSLADASREADELSDVRVGMAVGPVLEREGDCFGPTVNLASRITSIAFPGSVIVSSDLHERLADHEEYAWRSMRPRQLKNIGRVHLWVLRRATEGFESRFAEGRRALREAVRARIDTSGDANATT